MGKQSLSFFPLSFLSFSSLFKSPRRKQRGDKRKGVRKAKERERERRQGARTRAIDCYISQPLRASFEQDSLSLSLSAPSPHVLPLCLFPLLSSGSRGWQACKGWRQRRCSARAQAPAPWLVSDDVMQSPPRSAISSAGFSAVDTDHSSGAPAATFQRTKFSQHVTDKNQIHSQ